MPASACCRFRNPMVSLSVRAMAMRVNRRHRVLRLWLVATLAFLLVTGLALRPDRDLAQFLMHQSAETDGADIVASQMMAHIHLLLGQGLTRN